MIDRKARNQIARAIRAYMNEEITAFQFDEWLSELGTGTKDKTVRLVGRALWFHYDDIEDHKIVASKAEWDLFNRLLLLLESDTEMESTKTWGEWRPLQGAAVLLLLAFLVIAVPTGFGPHLFAYALPFGPPSMLLAWLNSRRARRAATAGAIVLWPFPSFESLRHVRIQVAEFVRRPYPERIASRRIRGPIAEKLMLLPAAILWCGFSPAVLFFQALPDREDTTRIKVSEPSAVLH